MENWLTRLELLFEDPAFERRWREDNYKRSLVQVRVATAIAVVIYGAYGFVDPIILPPEATDTNLWPHRLSGSVIIALVCISSFTSWFERFWQWLLFGGVMSVVVGLTWMWLDLGLSVYWYYHNGLVLILVFSVLLLRLTFRTTVLLVSTTFVLFVVTAFVLRPAPDINVVATSSLAFVSLIGLFAAGHLEANERKVYWQNTLIESQRSNLQESLDDLEAAQTQLIQAEKMASLGHLSAGIAHEIRNPLNFVSNFAAVSTEVLEDLEAELKNKKVAPEENQVIAESLEQLRDGSVHIQTHAARADQIVQRLIEHSDRSGGARTQANLNDVVSAGIEAAASRFVTKTRLELPELRVQYYESGIEVEMVRKEIGKVVDNLVDNALYSVYAKQKIDERFQGRVDVKTDLVDGSASVRVSDNGMGIPPESRKRIFEPFYTTRPTGEGTGLGLFLCYQIIASHFGDIEVESRDGQWANVMVTLPAARGKLTDDT